MKYKKTIVITAFLVLIVLLAYSIMKANAYYGGFYYEEFSPDKKYSIKYYESFNIFDIDYIEGCKFIWVRLYDSAGNKLKEKRVSNCAMGGDTRWYDDMVFPCISDTVWYLPDSGESTEKVMVIEED